jgi:hypothetical protein
MALRARLSSGAVALRETRSELGASIFAECFDSALTDNSAAPSKQTEVAKLKHNILKFMGKTGAGEGIRTLDPDLGKVVLYP